MFFAKVDIIFSLSTVIDLYFLLPLSLFLTCRHRPISNMNGRFPYPFPFLSLLVIPQLSFVILWCVCTFLLSYSLSFFLSPTCTHTFVLSRMLTVTFWNLSLCDPTHLSAPFPPSLPLLPFLSNFLHFLTLLLWSIPLSTCPWLAFSLRSVLTAF